jgi:hypothetical protein
MTANKVDCVSDSVSPNMTSGMNGTCTDDFFCVLLENHPTKIVSLTFAYIFLLTLPPCLWSIIWFERFGSDSKRTFVNKILSSLCWCAIEWGVFVHIPYIIR